MRKHLTLALALGLVACMQSAPPPPERKPSVLDDQVKAIDKAKAVEQEMLDAKQRQDAEMREQEG